MFLVVASHAKHPKNLMKNQQKTGDAVVFNPFPTRRADGEESIGNLGGKKRLSMTSVLRTCVFSKLDVFLEKVRRGMRGGVISDPKNFIANFYLSL